MASSEAADVEETTVSYTDTDGDKVKFVLYESGRLDYFESGEQVSDVRCLSANGTTVTLQGTSVGSFTAARETTVPDSEKHLVKKILALYKTARSRAVVEESSSSSESEEEEPEPVQDAVCSLRDARLAAAREYPSPLESLPALVQKATRVTNTRDLIVYSFEEEEKGSFVATVTLTPPTGSQTSRSGATQESKQKAKAAAALAALRDPEVHRLFPALPPKAADQAVKEKKAPAAVFDPEPRGGGGGGGKAPQLTKKQKEKLEKEAKAAKRKAAKDTKKTAFAALEAESSEEEVESSTEEKPSSSSEAEEDSEATSSEEEEASSSDEEEEGSDSDDDDEARKAAAAELAAKKAAVKAKLLAGKKGPKSASRMATAARERELDEAIEEKKRLAEKCARDGFQSNAKVLDTRKQKNFGLTKFIKP